MGWPCGTLFYTVWMTSGQPSDDLWIPPRADAGFGYVMTRRGYINFRCVHCFVFLFLSFDHFFVFSLVQAFSWWVSRSCCSYWCKAGGYREANERLVGIAKRTKGWYVSRSQHNILVLGFCNPSGSKVATPFPRATSPLSGCDPAIFGCDPFRHLCCGGCRDYRRSAASSFYFVDG